MPKRLPRLALPFLFALLLSGCSEPLYQDISNSELKALLQQGVPLIDIRTPREWRETGIVPNSHKITFFKEDGSVDTAFFPSFDALVGDKEKAVALICRTGNRTKSLANYLTEKLGYKRVYNVTNGITAWIGEGNPVVR